MVFISVEGYGASDAFRLGQRIIGHDNRESPVKQSPLHNQAYQGLTEAEWQIVINKTLINHSFEANGGRTLDCL